VVANADGGPMSLVFAAAHPERMSSLVQIDSAACYLRHDDYPAGMPAKFLDQTVQFVIGTDDGWVASYAPTLVNDEKLRSWLLRIRRMAAAPSIAPRMFQTGLGWDVRAVLPTINVPTLVISHAANRFIWPPHSRYLAEHVKGAKYLEFPGVAASFFEGDQDRLLDEIEAFLTGARAQRDHDRVLATVLFTDIVSSTERAADVGDSKWRDVLDSHDRLTAEQIDVYRGRLIKTTGDGALATFDGPARAIRCARSIAEGVADFGIAIRAGLHTGEVELRGDDVGGIAVHLASRVMGAAGPSEVLVSGTVKDLVIGSGIEFEDRGAHELKGVPGEWRLFAVAN